MATVRVAVEGDIPRILELYHQLVLSLDEPHREPYDCRWVFGEIAAFPGQELVVAEESSKVVGTLVLLVVPNLSHKARPWALVENIVVDEQYRRRGIADC